ncbi:hypothetical protein ABLA76_08200 [Xenorhabdus sp. SGI240]
MKWVHLSRKITDYLILIKESIVGNGISPPKGCQYNPNQSP